MGVASFSDADLARANKAVADAARATTHLPSQVEDAWYFVPKERYGAGLGNPGAMYTASKVRFMHDALTRAGPLCRALTVTVIDRLERAASYKYRWGTRGDGEKLLKIDTAGARIAPPWLASACRELRSAEAELFQQLGEPADTSAAWALGPHLLATLART